MKSYETVFILNPALSEDQVAKSISKYEKFLKSNGAKVSSGGFLVNNNFAIRGIKNTYTPSILATGFNPQRKTIFTAILKNSFLVGKSIAKNLLKV